MKKQLRCSLIALLFMCAVGFAQRAPDETRTASDDNSINLIYTPDDGNIALDIGANLNNLTTFQIESAGSLFVSEYGLTNDTPPKFINPPELGGIFDVYKADKSFKAVPEGFGDVAVFGNVGTGRTAAELLADFTIDGSFDPAGSVTDANLAIVVVPEPTGLAILVIGIIGWCTLRRR